jgi:hypothetical protein
MKGYISPPERRDTHRKITKVCPNLPETSNWYLTLYNYPSISLML